MQMVDREDKIFQETKEKKKKTTNQFIDSLHFLFNILPHNNKPMK